MNASQSDQGQTNQVEQGLSNQLSGAQEALEKARNNEATQAGKIKKTMEGKLWAQALKTPNEYPTGQANVSKDRADEFQNTMAIGRSTTDLAEASSNVEEGSRVLDESQRQDDQDSLGTW